MHIAPGHGQDDYVFGSKYGLPPYSPVDDDGKFTHEVPEFAGQKVWEANAGIIELLRQRGRLLAAADLTHSYPHCWRCKQPIIFRATEQWFISMEANDLRGKALAAIDRVTWIPRWGRERIYQMVERRPDWCISRQRAWGVPIVAFHCRECGEVLLTPEILQGIIQRVRTEGADFWFDTPAGGPAASGDRVRLRGLRLQERNRHPGCLVRFRRQLGRGGGTRPGPVPARRPLPGGIGPAPGLVSLAAS